MFLLIAILFLFCYLFMRITCGRTESSTCLLGKTAIVTGGNRGIGYQVVLNLASRGCRVVIADKDDSAQSRLKIVELTDNPNIVSKKLDLTSFKSIRSFVDEIKSSETRLDILINNAGVASAREVLTEDGLDAVMQANYFGPFLLTYLFLDLLKKSAPSRIIFTSSFLVFFGYFDWENLRVPKNRTTFLGRFLIYNNSKIATIMATDVLAGKLKGTGVTANSLNPGWVRTTLLSSFFSFTPKVWLLDRPLNVISYFFGKTIWNGAQTTTHLATSKTLDNTSGAYFWDCRRFPKPPQARSREIALKVWEISETTVGLSGDEKI